jgi:hypothetical protein
MHIFLLDKGQNKYSSARKFFPGYNGEEIALIYTIMWIINSRGGSSKDFLGGCWVSSRVFLYNSLGGGGRAFKWIGFLTTWAPKERAT